MNGNAPLSHAPFGLLPHSSAFYPSLLRFHGLVMSTFNPNTDILLTREGDALRPALDSITHLCVAAHQDDVEIMAQSAIDECLNSKTKFFAAVILCDGAGAPRSGAFAEMSDREMQLVRKEEQRCAARLGNYRVTLQFGHSSAAVKDKDNKAVQHDLHTLFQYCRPKVLLTHNPADKHDTHVAVLLHCLDALKKLPAAQRPEQMLGCEVWRSLDWLCDSHKRGLDAGKNPALAAQLLACFQSQIKGGKRYDLATEGRRKANATFHQARQSDQKEALIWALDLTPLLKEDAAPLCDFVSGEIDAFKEEVKERIQRLSNSKLASH